MGLYQLNKPHTFVLGAEYHKADVEISTTLPRIIERAELMKSSGTIWMSTSHGVYPVANFDGKGRVYNGTTTLTKASPEQILLLVDALWSRGLMGASTYEIEMGGLLFYREDPWQKSPVIPRSQHADGSVTAFSLVDANDWNFQAGELMSVGELIGQMKQILADKSEADWEKRLMLRIEALGLAAVASAPPFKAA
ncbi:hypothetical protein [Pseudomonas sp. NPDC089569]|uniref:hypothetical protein n=1 Tax=Pseudomonas sp. NPDC089569 TaxID=3390722 RepID=UPI003D00BA1E